MRFFTVVAATIVATIAAAPALATPVMNPLHNVGQYGGYRSANSKPESHVHRREDLEAREPMDELEARGFIGDAITKWLDEHIHLHRRMIPFPDGKPWSPKPTDGRFHILPYKSSMAIARDEFRTQVMPQGWSPVPHSPFQSPPFVRPGRPGGNIFHTLPFPPNKAVARAFRPWSDLHLGQPPPFIGSWSQSKRAAVAPEAPQKDKPILPGVPYVPNAVSRPPYGSGGRPGRPAPRPLVN